MIQITLKAKHFAFITTYLQEIVLDRFFKVCNSIANQLAQHYNGDREKLITVDCEPQDVIEVFNILSKQPGGEVFSINKEMLNLIMDQLTVKVEEEANYEDIYGEDEDGQPVVVVEAYRHYTHINSEIEKIKQNNSAKTLARNDKGFKFYNKNY